MRKLFDIDSPLLAFLSHVMDAILINLLVIVCSLPLVTVGAAITAANKAVQSVIFDTDTHIFRVYFTEFRNSIKRGILSGLLFLLACCVLICDFIWIYNHAAGMAGLLLYILLTILLILVISVFMHLYLLMARYDNSLRAHLYNAFALSVANPIRTLLLVILHALPLLIFLVSPSMFFRLIPGFLCIYPTIPIYVTNNLTRRTLLQLESQAT